MGRRQQQAAIPAEVDLAVVAAVIGVIVVRGANQATGGETDAEAPASVAVAPPAPALAPAVGAAPVAPAVAATPVAAAVAPQADVAVAVAPDAGGDVAIAAGA